MFGAIIGDMVGAKYEFNNIKTKDFPIESGGDFQYTDDSIMTLAVCDILQNGLAEDKDEIIDTLKKWGRNFPNAGYGSKFYWWVLGNDREAYNSCGNGSAMRVSACGWYGRNEEEVEKLATAVTEVTHNHPEGIKGAIVTAMCVYYARIGKSKEFIKEYAEKYYNLDFDYEELRESYYHGDEICQITVPQAIYCFLISKDFEDCLRTTISIGGDCDTTAAISCAIAEAYYKYIPLNIAYLAFEALPKANEECNAKSIIRNFIDDKNSLLVTTSEINEDTKFFAVKYKSNEGTSLEWIFSSNMHALVQYISSELMKDIKEGKQNLINQMTKLINANGASDEKIKMFENYVNQLLKKNNSNATLEYYPNKDDAFNYLSSVTKIIEYSDDLFDDFYII